MSEVENVKSREKRKEKKKKKENKRGSCQIMRAKLHLSKNNSTILNIYLFPLSQKINIWGASVRGVISSTNLANS